MSILIEFTTKRLYLRQWCAADREPFAQLNTDPRVMEFFPHRLDRATSDVLADRIEAQISDRGWGFWAVEIKATQEFIGFVGLNVPASDLPCSPCVEIGWRLAYPHWGYGYASEAAQASLQVGFEQLELNEIVSFTAIDNRRSRAVMERLRMHQSPETFLHPRIAASHPLAEHCLYTISQSEFQQDVPD